MKTINLAIFISINTILFAGWYFFSVTMANRYEVTITFFKHVTFFIASIGFVTLLNFLVFRLFKKANIDLRKKILK